MKDETKKVSPPATLMRSNLRAGKNRQKKEGLVAQMSDKVGRAKALVFTNYTGMKHQQLERLKRFLAPLNAEIAVTKNTLLKRALENGKLKMENSLEGPTATLFAYNDPIAPLKELAKVMKLFKLPTIKFAIFEGKNLDEQQVLHLSTLPTRDVLLAQVVGGLKSPLYGLHRALSWNLVKLAMTLKAIEAKKA